MKHTYKPQGPGSHGPRRGPGGRQPYPGKLSLDLHHQSEVATVTTNCDDDLDSVASVPYGNALLQAFETHGRLAVEQVCDLRFRGQSFTNSPCIGQQCPQHLTNSTASKTSQHNALRIHVKVSGAEPADEQGALAPSSAHLVYASLQVFPNRRRTFTCG